MATFQAKIGRTSMRKREIRITVPFRSCPTRVIKLKKKIAKKFKKLKSTFMATFQAEIGRKRMRKGEIKITVPFRSYPTCDRKFQKKGEKHLKNSKISMWLH